MPCNRGFTLVELVVVLVLAGIIGATIGPRFLDSSTFDALAARDSLLAVIRAGQQAAFGRSSVEVTITNAGDDWLVAATTGASELRSARFPSRAVRLETGAAAASTLTCATGFDIPVANDFRLRFDAEGNLASFTNNAVLETVTDTFNGLRLCIDDTVAMSLCVSRAGYAHEGNCDG